MAFKPLADRVVVERIDSEEKTAGGLIIPDSAKEKPSEGLFGKWSGTEITLEGKELLIMKESDILGVLS